MKISRLTIDKLGVQMHNRVSAVSAELIANSYDANAENVTIRQPFGQYLARRLDYAGRRPFSGHSPAIGLSATVSVATIGGLTSGY